MTARLTRASAPALAGALVCAALTGCSGDSAKEAKTTSTSVATSSPSPPSTTTSSTTGPATTASNSTYAGAPGVPEAAKYKTDAGAIAFAKYYLETVNKVGQQPKVGVLEPLALPSCKTCKLQQDTVKADVQKNQRVTGDQFIIKSAHRVTDPSTTTVAVICDQPAIDVVNSSGSTVESEPAKAAPFGMVFDLKWQGGWRAATIKLDKSASL